MHFIPTLAVFKTRVSGHSGEEVGNGGEEPRVPLAVTAVVCLSRSRWDARVPCLRMGEISAAGAHVWGLHSCPFSWMQDSFENGISVCLLIGRASYSGTWTRSTDRLRDSVWRPPTSPPSLHQCLLMMLCPDWVSSPWLPRTPFRSVLGQPLPFPGPSVGGLGVGPLPTLLSLAGSRRPVHPPPRVALLQPGIGALPPPP